MVSFCCDKSELLDYAYGQIGRIAGGLADTIIDKKRACSWFYTILAFLTNFESRVRLAAQSALKVFEIQESLSRPKAPGRLPNRYESFELSAHANMSSASKIWESWNYFLRERGLERKQRNEFIQKQNRSIAKIVKKKPDPRRSEFYSLDKEGQKKLLLSTLQLLAA